MARVTIHHDDDKDNSDALELALAFVDECDLLDGIDHDAHGDGDATTVASSTTSTTRVLSRGGSGSGSARPRAASRKGQQQQQTQTRKSEPTTKGTTRTAASGAGMSTAATKAPSRKDELSYLRAKVRELQVRLALLQKSGEASKQQQRNVDQVRREDEDATASPMSVSSAPHSRPSPEFLAQHRAMWESVAIRQSKEREKVEREDAQLKSLLESQLKVAKGLERILRKRGNVEDAVLNV